MFKNQALDLAQIMRANPSISRQRNRVQPKLALTIGIADMNMRRFIHFVREEVEPIRPDAQNRWHSRPVCGCQLAWQSNSDSYLTLTKSKRFNRTIQSISARDERRDLVDNSAVDFPVEAFSSSIIMRSKMKDIAEAELDALMYSVDDKDTDGERLFE